MNRKLFSRERVAQMLEEIVEFDRNRARGRINDRNIRARTENGIAGCDDIPHKVGITVCQCCQDGAQERLQGRDLRVEVSVSRR